MKKFLFTLATLAALATTSAAQANQCDQMGTEAINAVAAAYDAEIEKYRGLQNAGAVTVKIDMDGDGPGSAELYDVAGVIAAYIKAKADSLKEVEQSVSECTIAQEEAEANAKVGATAAFIDPGAAILSATVNSALDGIGLGPNNDLRGAIGSMINPVQPLAKVVTQPEKVIKKIIHKPLKIFTPWKW